MLKCRLRDICKESLHFWQKIWCCLLFCIGVACIFVAYSGGKELKPFDTNKMNLVKLLLGGRICAYTFVYRAMAQGVAMEDAENLALLIIARW